MTTNTAGVTEAIFEAGNADPRACGRDTARKVADRLKRRLQPSGIGDIDECEIGVASGSGDQT